MRSIRYRQGTRKWKKRNHRPLEWFTERFGTEGKKMFLRRG